MINYKKDVIKYSLIASIVNLDTTYQFFSSFTGNNYNGKNPFFKIDIVIFILILSILNYWLLSILYSKLNLHKISRQKHLVNFFIYCILQTIHAELLQGYFSFWSFIGYLTANLVGHFMFYYICFRIYRFFYPAHITKDIN